jgi:hypothetical protein
MAREAGLHRQQHNLMSNPIQYRYSYDGYEENLKAFEALVRADEREACAKVCDDLPAPERMSLDNESLWEVATLDCAEAIRARGNT